MQHILKNNVNQTNNLKYILFLLVIKKGNRFLRQSGFRSANNYIYG